MRKGVLSVLLVVVGGCSRSPTEVAPPTSSSAASAPAAAPAPSTAVEAPAKPAAPALALRWDDPSRWQKKKPSNGMRAAEYLVPRTSGDSDDGECIVITFGPGQGGGVDQNIDRWVGQFAGAIGTKKTTREANGTKITRVETAGTYTPMVMPGAASAGPATRPGWRLVGAIVEAPSGEWFFKLTGPAATVKAAAAEFDKMLDSARPS